MALATERDEIQLGIFARMAAKFLMVKFQVRHAPWDLPGFVQPGCTIEVLPVPTKESCAPVGRVQARDDNARSSRSMNADQRHPEADR